MAISRSKNELPFEAVPLKWPSGDPKSPFKVPPEGHLVVLGQKVNEAITFEQEIDRFLDGQICPGNLGPPDLQFGALLSLPWGRQPTRTALKPHGQRP